MSQNQHLHHLPQPCLQDSFPNLNHKLREVKKTKEDKNEYVDGFYKSEVGMQKEDKKKF